MMNKRQDWILFYVYGRVGYAYLAANAALSIKANGVDIPIKLCVCDYIYSKLNEGFKSLFDKVEIINNEDLKRNGTNKIDKCYAKLNFWKYKEGNGVNIFLDADSIVLSNKHFPEIINLAEKQGLTFGWINKGAYDSKMAWGERMTQYSRLFEVNLKDKYITAVSSYLLAFDTTMSFDGVIDTYDEYLATSKLSHNSWQNSVPDELVWQIYVNKIGLNKRDFDFVPDSVSTMYGNTINYDAIHKSSIMTFIGNLGGKAASYYNTLISDICARVNSSVPTYYMDKNLFSLNESIFINRGKLLNEKNNRNN